MKERAEEASLEPTEETQRKEWWRDTVWEKEHLIDGEGPEHGKNPTEMHPGDVP